MLAPGRCCQPRIQAKGQDVTSLPRSLLGAAVTLVIAFAATPLLAAERCAPETVDGTDYVICGVAPGKDDLRLFWRRADGAPYRYLPDIADAVRAEGKTLAFAVNAGMYHEDFSPIGLYVENGQELRPAATIKPPAISGPVPNFYKAPNGVFYLDDKGAGIVPTETYVQQTHKVRLATQSGPMLVIDGKINPIFIVGSTDRTRRSGVGVCEDGMVRFAVSDDAVNFHDFAQLFRDHLQCRNALFLDGGGGTGLYDAGMGRSDASWHGGYGPVFGVVE
jgi:uncharacterized protein YigE (DUF2233 family)